MVRKLVFVCAFWVAVAFLLAWITVHMPDSDAIEIVR